MFKPFAKLWNKVGNNTARDTLRVAIETNQPELAVNALIDAIKLAPLKEFKEGEAKVFFESTTRSTRSLVERAIGLYDSPEHSSAINHPQPRTRSAYDWLFLENHDGTELDIRPLIKLLNTPVPAKRISKRSRFANWLDERQALVNDTLLLCDLVLNRMTFK